MKGFLRLAVATFWLTALFSQAQILTTAQARDHVGEAATVCGQIVSETTASGSRGTPTLINLDKAYPDQVFTVLVWGSDKAAVGPIPRTGRVCVKGTITLYRGVPEIVVHKTSDVYVSTLSNGKYYTNSDGQSIHVPAYSNSGPPAGVTARCLDGTYSFSQHHQGTCSHHGGVSQWLP